MPFTRRYRADRKFHKKRLGGKWYTDTMDGCVTSVDGNRYAQVFDNKIMFAQVYPMDSKSKAGDALKTFINDVGVPGNLTIDGSKEQNGNNKEFTKQVCKHNI